VNEICDTPDLVLDEMTVRADPSAKERPHSPDFSISASEALKAEYYHTKFGETRPGEIVTEYLKGMAWVFRYYTHGCASWSWFYPFLFPPCISDFAHSGESPIDRFDLGQPFHPLVQLMAVLPPQSAHALPEKMQELVVFPESPLHDYFPVQFKVDLFGERKTWKGFVLIPFIDARLLCSVLEQTDLQLTPEERERNEFGKTRIFTTGDGFGPHFWGTITPIADTEFFFESPLVAPDQDLAFLLLGAKAPPIAITPAMSLDKPQNRFPVQIPGYPPGESQDYRERFARPRRTGRSAFLF
jgi:5'-3' exoribonuclease 2